MGEGREKRREKEGGREREIQVEVWERDGERIGKEREWYMYI